MVKLWLQLQTLFKKPQIEIYLETLGKSQMIKSLGIIQIKIYLLTYTTFNTKACYLICV